jgi:hypothetical protein
MSYKDKYTDTIDITDPTVNYSTRLKQLTIKDTVFEEEVFLLLDQKDPLVSEVLANIDKYSAKDMLYAWICAELNPKDDIDKVIEINDIKLWMLKKAKVFKNLGMNI